MESITDHAFLYIVTKWADKLPNEMDIGIRTAFAAGYRYREQELPFMDGAYPLPEVLKYLIEAADILLHKHDYDGHNWEVLQHAMERGRQILEEINAQLETFNELK